jgi:hypothetical protein
MMQCEQRANYILDRHLPMSESAFHSRRARSERRVKPRSVGLLPARVWGVDIDDQPFSFDCSIDNISGPGPRPADATQDEVFGGYQSSCTASSWPFRWDERAIKGTVVRDELELDGHRGVGVRIVEHNFI